MENPIADEIPDLCEFPTPDPDVEFLVHWAALVEGSMRGLRFALAEAAEETQEALAAYQGRVSPCGLHVVSWGALSCPYCQRIAAAPPIESVRRW